MELIHISLFSDPTLKVRESELLFSGHLSIPAGPPSFSSNDPKSENALENSMDQALSIHSGIGVRRARLTVAFIMNHCIKDRVSSLDLWH